MYSNGGLGAAGVIELPLGWREDPPGMFRHKSYDSYNPPAPSLTADRAVKLWVQQGTLNPDGTLTFVGRAQVATGIESVAQAEHAYTKGQFTESAWREKYGTFPTYAELQAAKLAYRGNEVIPTARIAAPAAAPAPATVTTAQYNEAVSKLQPGERIVTVYPPDNAPPVVQVVTPTGQVKPIVPAAAAPIFTPIATKAPPVLYADEQPQIAPVINLQVPAGVEVPASGGIGLLGKAALAGIGGWFLLRGRRRRRS